LVKRFQSRRFLEIDQSFFLGSVALAEVIADSPKLVRVDLRENEIKTAGMMALALALKVNVIQLSQVLDYLL
jgi:hypothetical protein